MTQRQDLAGIAGRDLIFELALTAGGNPLNLAGITVTIYLKATAVTPDAIAVMFTSGQGFAITDTAGGALTWTIPAADVPLTAAPGSLWYRVDVAASGSDPQPAMCGALSLTPA